MSNHMTVQQAQLRACPLTKMRDHSGEAKCCANSCMAWRWLLDADGEIAQTPTGPVGRCGLAGPNADPVMIEQATA